MGDPGSHDSGAAGSGTSGMSGGGVSDPEVNRAIHQRWRIVSMVAVLLLGLVATGSTLSALLYDFEPVSLLVPVCLWAGVAAQVMAWRATPHGVTVAQRPAMVASGLWTVLTLLLFFGGPLVLDAVGLA